VATRELLVILNATYDDVFKNGLAQALFLACPALGLVEAEADWQFGVRIWCTPIATKACWLSQVK